MHISKKWAALAIVHLTVITCLAVGVMLIAIRLGQHPRAVNSVIPSIPTNPPTDAEIARLNLLSTKIDVMQDNLSNADTVAFKRQRVIVEDGVQPKVGALQLDMTQGALESTNQNTDIAIQGEGFFHVKLRPTVADGTGYTRIGSLFRKRNGDLVVGIRDGYELIPPINIPSGALQLSIDTDGVVTYMAPGSEKITTAGQIQLCRFTNPQQLGRVDGFFTETVASGIPVVGNPGDNGTGNIQEGFLESSNVDPLKEWVGLLRAQKMFQFSSETAQIDRKAI